MTAEPRFHGIEIDGALALALLEWQREMGADEAVLDAPVNRFEVAEPAAPAGITARAPQDAGTGEGGDQTLAASPAAGPHTTPQPPPAITLEAESGEAILAEARRLAASAATLEELAALQSAFDGIELKRGARNFVFSDGNPAASLMVIGEAPGEEEDAQGRPFVGRAGQLLDQMLAAIGLARESPNPDRAVYIANVITWRPPGNRRPQPSEIAASLPFLTRHVELAAPEIILLMGNTSCQAVLGRTGITRMRGQWTEAFGRPALPMLHPAYLLRTPIAKREAWADLLSVAARLGLS